MIILAVVIFFVLLLTVVSHYSEHLASAFLDLLNNLLSHTVMNLGITQNHNRAVAFFGNNCGIDNLTERRCIDNYIIIYLAAFGN